MLEFQKSILDSFISENDQLLILSPGLGSMDIVRNLCLIYNSNLNEQLKDTDLDIRDKSISKGLVFILGGDNQVLSRYLWDMDVPFIDSSISSDSRSEIYKKGGIICVTSRILVVDMLSKKVPIDKISGFLILDAHDMAPQCTESFILRLFRQENKDGFIKAISSRPDLFHSTFMPLQNVLKSLLIRNALIYPRFQVEVSKELENGKTVEVVELRQPLTKKMKMIQSSLMECLNLCVIEIKRSKILREIEEELTLDNALSRNFVYLLRRSLDSRWHQLGYQIKETISDIVTLKTLLTYLTNYDSITFLKYLDTILAANSSSSNSMNSMSSPWLLSDAANALILASRSRVYIKNPTNETIPKKLILEPQPKWLLVQQLIEEISEESKKSQKNARILISTSSERTTHQFQAFLRDYDKDRKSHHPMLVKLYEDYQIWKSGIGNIISSGSICQMTGKNNNIPDKNVANKRRRVRGNTATGGSGLQTTISTWVNITDNKLVSSAPIDLTNETEEKQTYNNLDSSILDTDSSEWLPFEPDAFDSHFGLIDPPSSAPYEILIHTYMSSLDSLIIKDFQPTHFIMVDPEPSFIRRVECYQAQNNEETLKAYLLLYSDSIEEQRFLGLVRREKDAFEQLIKERANMVITLEDLVINPVDSLESSLLLSNRGNTRLAGGQNMTNNSNKIIVDVREFRSSLPSNLHQHGFELIPVTLTIGDYILTPSICVERKSVPDLIGSFRSGRLDKQIKNMLLYYKIVVLLIEFEESTFGLEALGDQRYEFSLSEIRPKLSLLSLAFPSLKIVWSSSPKVTASIYRNLKIGQEDPDVETSIKIGGSESEVLDKAINHEAVNLLLSFPGIDQRNVKLVTDKVRNIKELVEMSLEQLTGIIGSKNATLLFNFFNKISDK